jgi:hypothetical protein
VAIQVSTTRCENRPATSGKISSVNRRNADGMPVVERV